MNFDIIIEEELDAARERIKTRVAQLFLGGGVASPSPGPRAGRPPKTYPPLPPPPGARLTGQQREDIILAYLKENPGSYGKDLTALFPGESPSNYKAAMVRLASAKAIIKRGHKNQMTYWLTGQGIPKSPTPPGPEVKVLTSNGRAAPASIEARKKRDAIFMKMLADNPKGLTTGELIAAVKHLGFSLGANQSAVHRLVEDPRVSMKKNAAGERIHKLK